MTRACANCVKSHRPHVNAFELCNLAIVVSLMFHAFELRSRAFVVALMFHEYCSDRCTRVHAMDLHSSVSSRLCYCNALAFLVACSLILKMAASTTPPRETEIHMSPTPRIIIDMAALMDAGGASRMALHQVIGSHYRVASHAGAVDLPDDVLPRFYEFLRGAWQMSLGGYGCFRVVDVMMQRKGEVQVDHDWGAGMERTSEFAFIIDTADMYTKVLLELIDGDAGMVLFKIENISQLL